jgi:hypothetical protein
MRGCTRWPQLDSRHGGLYSFALTPVGCCLLRQGSRPWISPKQTRAARTSVGYRSKRDDGGSKPRRDLHFCINEPRARTTPPQPAAKRPLQILSTEAARPYNAPRRIDFLHCASALLAALPGIAAHCIISGGAGAVPGPWAAALLPLVVQGVRGTARWPLGGGRPLAERPQFDGALISRLLASDAMIQEMCLSAAHTGARTGRRRRRPAGGGARGAEGDAAARVVGRGRAVTRAAGPPLWGSGPKVRGVWSSCARCQMSWRSFARLNDGFTFCTASR